MGKKILFLFIIATYSFNSYSIGSTDQVLNSVVSFYGNCKDYPSKINSCSEYDCEYKTLYANSDAKISIIGAENIGTEQEKCLVELSTGNQLFSCKYSKNEQQLEFDFNSMYIDSIDKGLKNSSPNDNSTAIIKRIFDKNLIAKYQEHQASLFKIIMNKEICSTTIVN